ncbi:hypothetical protein [Neolewinella antarctica]|uniref:Outer membrane protein beta-barrel domain-containing protein n=1 Tax=Neolewinella antarctica TaxID=442734 RepID=A0ABX0XH24_9BACT|nr:hypothetical protein [Neolewinella antarctica]NJC28176.1 hypothetical protein [Neolewinella antarctica]
MSYNNKSSDQEEPGRGALNDKLGRYADPNVPPGFAFDDMPRLRGSASGKYRGWLLLLFLLLSMGGAYLIWSGGEGPSTPETGGKSVFAESTTNSESSTSSEGREDLTSENVAGELRSTVVFPGSGAPGAIALNNAPVARPLVVPASVPAGEIVVAAPVADNLDELRQERILSIEDVADTTVSLGKAKNIAAGILPVAPLDSVVFSQFTAGLPQVRAVVSEQPDSDGSGITSDRKALWVVDLTGGGVRTNIENSLTGNVGELSLGRRLGSNFMLSAGVGRVVLRNGYSLDAKTDARVFQPGTVDTIFQTPDGEFMRQTTTDSVAGVRHVSFQHTDRFRSYYLPVRLDWEARSGRFSYGAGVLVGYHFIQSQNVARVTEAGELVGFSPVAQARWRYGVRAVGGVRLTDRFGLRLNLEYGGALGRWGDLQATARGRVSVVGVVVGLRYCL